MLLQVDKTQVDDLAYCKTAMLGFQSFIAQFEGQSLYTRRDLDFKNVTATITDLIYFVTISDILDPILREGLPHPSRQLLLREQQVLDRAMECIQVPFKHHYKFSELSSEKARNKPSVKPLHMSQSASVIASSLLPSAISAASMLDSSNEQRVGGSCGSAKL